MIKNGINQTQAECVKMKIIKNYQSRYEKVQGRRECIKISKEGIKRIKKGILLSGKKNNFIRN